MKKILAILLASVLTLSLLSACGSDDPDNGNGTDQRTEDNGGIPEPADNGTEQNIAPADSNATNTTQGGGVDWSSVDPSPADHFEWVYNSEYGGIEITKWIQQPNVLYVRIPGEIAGEPVVAITNPAGANRGGFGYAKVKEVYIPSTVKLIGDSAFTESEIAAVTLPEGLLKIGSGAFGECSGLTELILPSSIVEIGSSAFIRTGLVRVEIGDGVGEIHRSAFLGCASLNEASRNRILEIQPEALLG